MKHIRLLSFTLSAFLSVLLIGNTLTPAVYAAESVSDYARISGKAILCVPADTATVSFCVEARESKEEKAMQKNAEILQRIRDRLTEAGIPLLLTEDSFCRFENPDCGGVCVSRYMTLILNDLTKVAGISDLLISAGASSINCIWYSLRDSSAYAENLLALAIEDARQKLGALEGEFTVRSVEEQGIYTYCDSTQTDPAAPLVTVCCDIFVNFAPTRRS